MVTDTLWRQFWSVALPRQICAMPLCYSDPMAQFFRFGIALARSLLLFEALGSKVLPLSVHRISSPPQLFVLNALIQHISAKFRIRVVSHHIRPSIFAVEEETYALDMSPRKAQIAR